MIIRNISKRLIVNLGRNAIGYQFSTGNSYIPVRPLKEGWNILFDVGRPNPISFFKKFVMFSPFMAFVL